MEELTNAINLKNTHPITDEVGESLKPFRFKLTNTCGVGVDYNVNLEVMETESRIASKNIATKVDENAKSILSNNPTAPITYQESDYTGVEAYTIHSGSIEPYGSVEHEVRIWLDESAGNDSQNGTFYSKVVIDARQNQNVIAKLSDYIIEQMEEDNSIEEFTHEATSQTIALTDYRYTGANPNNYVYFGCEEDCTLENLYRIIGVMPTQSEVGGEYENRVKLMKANNYVEHESGYLIGNNSYDWNSSNSNNWETATLNNNILNKVYWESLREYQNYIASALWYLGGATNNIRDTYSPNNFYNFERGNSQSWSRGSLNYVGNIGLLYPSDYGYSIGNEYVNDLLYPKRDYYKTNSWLLCDNLHFYWSITPHDINSSTVNGRTGVFGIYKDGQVGGMIVTNSIVNPNSSVKVHPTFYLKVNVIYKSGSGTEEDPYRIGIDE